MEKHYQSKNSYFKSKKGNLIKVLKEIIITEQKSYFHLLLNGEDKMKNIKDTKKMKKNSRQSAQKLARQEVNSCS